MMAPSPTIAGAEFRALIDFDTEAFADEAWSAATWQQTVEAAHRIVRIVNDSNGIAAVVVVSVLGDQAELERIAVRSDARRRGMAAKLLTRVIDESCQRGATSMILEVRADNAAARSLYQTNGFVEISRRAGYYVNGTVDAVIMTRAVTTRGATT